MENQKKKWSTPDAKVFKKSETLGTTTMAAAEDVNADSKTGS